MSLDMPVLLYQTQTLRAPYLRRMGFNLVLTLVMVAGFFITRHITYQEQDHADMLFLGMMFFLLVGLLLFVRVITLFLRWRRTHNERVRVYDQGIIWEKDGELRRYGWDKIKRYRRGARVATLFKKPLWIRGDQTLWMVNSDEFRFHKALGDPREFDYVISPIIADVTGERMGMALREKRAVKLADNLMMASGGIVAGKHKIGWKTVDIQLQNNQLVIYKLAEGGKFQPLVKIPAHQIDNLVGFMDVAESIIQNYQPHRFNIRTKG